MEEPKLPNPILEKIGNHSTSWLRSKHTGLVLSIISFSESVIAPIIIDPFLVAVVIARREKWLYFTNLSIVSSIVGGVVGYLLGFLFYNFIGVYIISFYGLDDQIMSMTAKLNENAFAFVLVGAFTPVPYKLVAIASGLTKLNFITFFFASVFGRMLRLGFVGFAAYRFGPKALPIVQKNLLTLAYLAGFVLLLYISIQLFF